MTTPDQAFTLDECLLLIPVHLNSYSSGINGIECGQKETLELRRRLVLVCGIFLRRRVSKCE